MTRRDTDEEQILGDRTPEHYRNTRQSGSPSWYQPRDSGDVGSVLDAATRMAVQVIGGVEYASVTLIEGEEPVSRAPTAAVAAALDAVQFQLGEGPCLHAATTNEVIVCPDLGQESRWTGFTAAAVHVGVRSVVSLPLFTNRRVRSSLNLFGSDVGGIRASDHPVAAMVARHCTLTLLAADRDRQFRAALDSRDVIGQAKGIVMERYGLDAAAAFATLRRLSQDNNMPVREVAAKIAFA